MGHSPNCHFALSHLSDYPFQVIYLVLLLLNAILPNVLLKIGIMLGVLAVQHSVILLSVISPYLM